MNARSVRIAALMLAALPLLFGFAAQRDEIPITTSSSEARALVQKAIGQMEALRFTDAVDNLKKAVDLDHDCAFGYYCLAVCATTPTEARTQIDKALALVGKVSDGEGMLIRSFEDQINGDQAGATATLKKLVAMYPKDKRAHFNYAGALYGMQQWPEAINELNAAIDIDHTYAPAFNLLGYAEIRANNLPKAEKALKDYVTLIPSEPNPHDSYAELLLKEGKYDESIASYQRALKLDPNFHSSVIGIANAYVFKGMPGEARKQLQGLYDNADDPGWKITALDEIASTYVSEGRFDQALEQLNKAHDLAVSLKDPMLIAEQLNHIGTTVLESSSFDATRGTYLKTKTPETAKVDQAATYFDDANRAVASSDLPRDVKTRTDAFTLVNKVEVALTKNDIPAAKSLSTQFDEAAKNDKDMDIQRYQHQIRGMIAMSEKRFPDAISELQQANLRNPLNLYRLSEAYEAAGNGAKAKELRSQIWSFNEDSFNLAFVRPLARPTE